ncbi:Stf0 family sulfotransferase [Novosphingobium sp. TH158]|uniref:Stf0 family sulfotransferase n=1 Tax=Novosphingobium sp. TH158 TaxID=2067455 RepID=UPI000C7D7518|nr:Stf0 family sulfotransferase [Novosphingobium sp. TH158]PLK24416.1 hypothetical protein C0V78_14290 [Novosphingobium sp. TH158]
MWDGPPRRSILICTLPRSGSTLLGEAFYFASGLGCPLEYFHAGFRPAFASAWQAHTLPDLRDAVWRHRTDPSGTLSVKLMWRDIQELAIETDPVLFAPLIEQPPERVPASVYRSAAALLEQLFPAPITIHLFRRDRVRQAVSACIANETGQWRAIEGAGMQRVREPTYDAAAILHQISYADHAHGHWRNLLGAMPQPPIAVAYEDLLGAYTPTLSGLFAHLGHPGPVPPARMQRQADGQSEAFVRQFLLETAHRATPPGTE